METLLVSLLAPFLGRLLEGPMEAAQEAAGRAGDVAWKHAVSIWRKVWPKLQERPSAEEAAREVANNPEDEDAQASLRLQLRKLLEQDPALARELEGPLAEASRDGVVAGGESVVIQGGVNASQGGIAVGRDVRGNVTRSGQ